MAATGHLSWFIDNLIDAYQEDENESALWDLWLHRVWNKSFEDFKREQMNKARSIASSERARKNPKEAAKTVMKSRAIIEMFSKPVEEK